ncbi:MAG: polysaccharide biosynthesis tyrosine autokinase [Pseudomonadota bacterium]
MGSLLGLSVTPIRSAAGLIQGNLAATPVRNTRLIQLKMTNPDPHEAQRLLSGLVSAYRQIKLEQKTQVASKALDFINEQLQTVDKQLQQGMGELKHYKEEHKFVNLDENVQVVINRLAQTESAKKGAEMLSSQAKLLLANLEGKGSVDQESLYTLGTTLDQPMLLSLASNLTGIQSERAALRSQYTEKHPKIQALDEQILELKRKIRAEISSLLASLEGKASALAQEIKRTEAQIGTLPEAEQKLAELTRNAKVHQDTYAFMLQKRGEIQVTRASQIGDVWVVEPAYANPNFIKPKLKLNLALGLILGLMLGMGLAFFMEYLDDSVKNAEDIQTLVSLPVLGNIGHYGGIENGRPNRRCLMLLEEPDSHISEAFRSFRSNLLFTSVDKTRQLMVFSSPLPEDGKSTCAANLAVALSQTGKKVLLVDTDLRRPTQHRIFRCRRSPGIVNVLVSEDWEKALGEAIQPSETNGLDLLVCGDKPPNPNEIIGSEKMGQVLDAIRKRYDFVVFDTPPLLTVSDALVLAQRLDGILCVVRAQRTSRKALKSAVELLAQVKTPVMGIVLNDIDFKQERYYYGYHYKYYRSYYGSGKEKGGKGQRA